MADRDRDGRALLGLLARGRVLREDEPVLGRIGDVLLDHRDREAVLLEQLRRRVLVVLRHLRNLCELRALGDGQRHRRAARRVRVRSRVLRDDGAGLRSVRDVHPCNREARSLERALGVRVLLAHDGRHADLLRGRWRRSRGRSSRRAPSCPSPGSTRSPSPPARRTTGRSGRSTSSPRSRAPSGPERAGRFASAGTVVFGAPVETVRVTIVSFATRSPGPGFWLITRPCGDLVARPPRPRASGGPARGG